MNNKTYLDIRLNVARENLIMGLQEYFDKEIIDFETAIKESFDNFDYKEYIEREVRKVLDESIKQAINSYLKYGEGSNLIKQSLNTILGLNIEKVVKELVEKEIGLNK